MQFLELKIPPPLVALLVGTAMWFAAGVGPVATASFNVRLSACFVLAIAGGLVALAGEIEFHRAKTTINPLRPQNATALVTSGIYGRTRNPMYVGLALALVGWAAFLSALIPLIGPPLFMLYITRFQIRPEERVLRGKFGEAYERYLSRVRRWL